MQKIQIAILGSGSGTNAQSIIEYSYDEACGYSVGLIVASKPGIGIISVANVHSIPVYVLDGIPENRVLEITRQLQLHSVKVIVLAGYLLLLEKETIGAVKGNVLNVHPALLPKYGGVGMYGNRVHEAVLANGDQVTGVTVHLVDEEYDKGPIVEQDSVIIPEGITVEGLRELVLKIEHKVYPRSIDKFVKTRFSFGSIVR
ncbi:MAG: phosphoribosylglycinamide formyltransferase [Ignavibacteria bacterium]|nr:phosphoribosylglycinamide formyltransferase [Ignavibacteria bacterium]